MLVEHPLRPPFPLLALPNRHGRLRSVNAVTRHLERFRPVRSRSSNDNRDVADDEPSHPMKEGDTARHRPALPGRPGDLRETRFDLFDVCLVLERDDTRSTL